MSDPSAEGRMVDGKQRQGTDGAPSAGGRTVADLSLPASVVVWAMRQWAAGRGSSIQLRPTFVRAFGAVTAETAIVAFRALCASWSESARTRLHINGFDDGTLSAHERQMLAAIAALQAGESARLHLLLQWMVRPPARDGFARRLGVFARLLQQAGLEPGGTQPAPPPRRHNSAPPHSVCHTADLETAELVLLYGTRAWVDSIRKDRKPYPVLQGIFAHHATDNGALSLNAVLRNLLVAATAQIDIRCPNCPHVSLDEARLLRAVAAGQHGDNTPAYETLSCWLPLAAVRLTVDAIGGLATSFLRARLVLPRRDWDLEAVPAAATLLRSHVRLVR